MFMFLTVQSSPVALLCGLLLGDVEDNMKNKVDIMNKNTLPFPKKPVRRRLLCFSPTYSSEVCSAIRWFVFQLLKDALLLLSFSSL